MVKVSDRKTELLGGGKVEVTYYDAATGGRGGDTTTTTTTGIMVCTICRPNARNAVDRETADALYDAFVRFARDSSLSVAILTGQEGQFCAGADLKSIQSGVGSGSGSQQQHRLDADMDAPGPMGVTRLVMNKPVIGAVSGYAVAGGLELAAWCDVRVGCAQTAKLGVLCRLRGVPLIDGGTVRLPALLGLSRATDLILTGRVVDAQEAHAIGLLNYTVDGGPSAVLEKALELAESMCAHPPSCMLNDRASLLSVTYGLRDVESSGSIAAPLQDVWESTTATPELNNAAPDLRLKGRMRQAMQREFQLGLQSLAVLEQEGAVAAFVNKAKPSSRL